MNNRICRLNARYVRYRLVLDLVRVLEPKYSATYKYKINYL